MQRLLGSMHCSSLTSSSPLNSGWNISHSFFLLHQGSSLSCQSIHSVSLQAWFLQHKLQSEQCQLCPAYLDHCDQEPLLILLVHGAADGADGPAQRVQVLPGPLCPIHLIVKLLSHNSFCVCIVQMCEINWKRAMWNL